MATNCTKCNKQVEVTDFKGKCIDCVLEGEK